MSIIPVRLGKVAGRANVELTPETAAELGSALGTMLGERSLVVAGRDYYPPSRMLKRAFSSGLMSTGITVVDFHAVTTPELVFSIKRFGAKAGVEFTVSPLEEDNVSIKIFDSYGIEYSYDRILQLVRLVGEGRIARSIPSRIGWVVYAEYVHEIYNAAVAGFIDSDALLASGHRIVVDMSNGPANLVIPDLFSQLGIDLVSLNVHKPPLFRGVQNLPLEESIRVLRDTVASTNADFGIALCADANRAVFVTEEGEVVDPEQMVVLFASRMARGGIVVLSNSMFPYVDMYLESVGAKPVRVEHGPGSLARAVRRYRAALGSSDLHEYVFPGFSLSSDGILAMMKTVEMLSKEDKGLSEMLAKIRPRLLSEEVESSAEPLVVYKRLLREVEEGYPVVTGVKFRVEGGYWVRVRKGENGFLVETDRAWGSSVLRKGREVLEKVLSSIT